MLNGTAWPALLEGQVHVWRAALDTPPEQVDRCRLMLSVDERQRAAAFVFERDRARFINARAVLRVLLGRYLEVPPGQLAFQYGRHGKPALGGPSLPAVQFSVSHSADVALYAVARGRHLGVDIEMNGRDADYQDLASRLFAADEVAALDALHGRERRETFFRCWTRKEAYLKGRGTGLHDALDGFSVAPLHQVWPAPAAVLHDSDGVRWAVHDVPTEGTYAAALAIEGSATAILLRTWSWNDLAVNGG